MTTEQVDGLALDKFAGRFLGTFELENNYHIDDEVVFMVVAKVTGFGVTTTAQGDLKRVNKFSVLDIAMSTDMPTSRRIMEAAEQIHNEMKVEDVEDPDGDLDLDWDDPDASNPPGGDVANEEVEAAVLFGNSPPVLAPNVSVTVPAGQGFTRGEYLDEQGWN